MRRGGGLRGGGAKKASSPSTLEAFLCLHDQKYERCAGLMNTLPQFFLCPPSDLASALHCVYGTPPSLPHPTLSLPLHAKRFRTLTTSDRDLLITANS